MFIVYPVRNHGRSDIVMIQLDGIVFMNGGLGSLEYINKEEVDSIKLWRIKNVFIVLSIQC